MDALKAIENAESEQQVKDIKDGRVKKWVEDDKWILNWLLSQPHIFDQDLTQYYYFSRDSIRIETSISNKLSSKGLECLKNLCGDSEIEAKKSLNDLKELPLMEATVIITAILQKSMDSNEDKKSKLFRIFVDSVKIRKKDISDADIIQMLKSYSPSTYNIGLMSDMAAILCNMHLENREVMNEYLSDNQTSYSALKSAEKLLINVTRYGNK